MEGRYGKRGQLLASIARLFDDAAPRDLTTTKLIWTLQLDFHMNFPTAVEKQTW
jgi:hypothetical protein